MVEPWQRNWGAPMPGPGGVDMTRPLAGGDLDAADGGAPWQREWGQPSPSGGTTPGAPRASGSGPARASIFDRVNRYLFGDDGFTFEGDVQRPLGLGVGDIVEGAGDVVGLLSNPLYAGANLATGEDALPTDLGATWRRSLGLPEPETLGERLTGAAIQGASGGVGVVPIARQVALRTASPIVRTVASALANPTEEIVGGAAAGGAQQLAQEAGAGPILSTLAAFAGGAAGATGARGVRSLWDTPRLTEEELIAGSLDGSSELNGRPSVDEVLSAAGYGPDQFSTPELAAAAADRVRSAQARPSFNDMAPDFIAQLREMNGGAPKAPARTVPDDVTMVAAPEGTIRSDDLGGQTGLARQRSADSAVLREAEDAAERDPVFREILDSGLSPRAKLSTLFDRLERFREGGPGGVPEFAAIPDAPDLPPVRTVPRYRASTPEAAGLPALSDGGRDYLSRMERHESGGDATARNPRSTATGPHQFTESTWLSMYRQRFGNTGESRAQILAKRTNRETSTLLAADLTAANEAGLRSANIPVTDGNRYLAHFAGISGARRLHEANPNAPVEQVLGARVVEANPFLRGKTAAETIQWAHGAVGDGARGTAPAPYRMSAPDGDEIDGLYTAASRPNPDEDGTPARQDFQGFERTDRPTSATMEELEAGQLNGGRRTTGQSASGPSDRPFRDVRDDPPEQAGFWEQRSRDQAEAGFNQRMADLEAEWARRRAADEERARRSSGKTRFEEERTSAGEDPASRYGGRGYGQRPAQDNGIWRTTGEGLVADADGRPVAFRNAREAARWAARNEMGGDFELAVWGTNSARVTLRRRANSQYGQTPPRPTPGAGPVDPPAGRSADPTQRAISSPSEAAPAGPVVDSPTPRNGPEAPAGAEIDGSPGYTPPPQPEPAPRPAPEPEKRAPIQGETEQVVTARGRQLDTQFEVRELDDLISSDMPAYDPALQPRDRAARSSSDAQVAEIAAKLDPGQLGSSRLASQGAPIIGADRMVDSGNGRVQALRRAYDLNPKAARAYRQMIAGRGFDVADFEKPVLVRRHGLQGDDRLSFVREANERDTMGMSSTEQARTDASAMSDGTLGRYRGGAVTGLNNRDFVRAWMDEVATPADRNALMQSDGTLSTDGIRRIRSSLLSRAFDDADLVAKIVEDPETEIRAIGNTLTEAAPAFARLRQKVAAGELDDEFDISGQVAEMANMIARARGEGRKVADLVRQDDMFGGRVNPVTEALTRLMFKDEALTRPRSASDMAEGLRFFTDEAEKVRGGPSLLEDAPAARPIDILNTARERLEAKAQARDGDGARLFFRAQTEGLASFRPADRPLAAELERLATESKNVGYRALAERLAGLVGDAEVRYGDLEPGLRGAATLAPDGTASARIARLNDPEALLHEATHIATLSRYGELRDGIKTGTAADAPLRELEQLRDRANRAFRDRDGEAIRYALSSTDEFLAHGFTSPEFQGWLKRHETAGLWGRFTDWVRGLLGLDRKNGSLLDGVLQSGARLLRTMEADRPAPRDGATLYSREFEGAPKPDATGFRRIVDGVVDVDGLKADAATIRSAIGKPMTTLRSFTGPMKRVISAGFFTNDARVRGLAARFDSDALNEYANLWFARPGKGDSTGRTYHEAVSRAATTRTQRAYEALEPFLGNQAAERRIRDMLTSPNKTVRATVAERKTAETLRDMLRETIGYRKDAGEDIGEVAEGYFPRVLNAEKVIANRDEFLRRAEQLYRSIDADDPKASAERWVGHIFDTYAGLDGGLAFTRGAGGGMGSSTAEAREFGRQADQLLGDYYDDDVFRVLSSYFTGSAKRAEYARRFGAPGREGSAERAAWVREHGDRSRFDVLTDRIKQDVRASGETPDGVLQVLDSVHRSNLGQMGTSDPFARTAVSYLHTWNQLAKMDRTTITSLGELTMGFVRGGGRAGFRFLKDSVQDFARQLRGAEPNDAKRWAEAIGVANDAMVNQVLTSRISAEHSTAGAQKVLAGFYRAIGLHQFTEATRSAAVSMGRNLIDTFARDLQSSAPRVRRRAETYLRELGVQDVNAFAARVLDRGFSREEVLRDEGLAAEYGTALLRLVNQTIMMPSRAEKPTWASHPVGSLVFSLMGYSYGFKKNVLDRVGRLGIEGVKTRDPKLLLPAMSMSIMVAFQALNDTILRPMLFGSSYDFASESPTEFMMRVADRSGLTGGLSPFINAIKAVRYDRSLLESLSGPVVGTIADTGQKFVELYSERNSANTNTAERNAAAAFYDAVLDPIIDGFASARLRGVTRTAAVLGTGNREGGIAPGDREAFVGTVGGQRETE